MNGKLFILKKSMEFICENEVTVYHYDQWLILTLSYEDRSKIEKTAKAILNYEKSPFTEDGKLFFGIRKIASCMIWNPNKEKSNLNELPKGKFMARASILLPRFTKYNNVLSFKLELKNLMFLSKEEICPF